MARLGHSLEKLHVLCNLCFLAAKAKGYENDIPGQ